MDGPHVCNSGCVGKRSGNEPNFLVLIKTAKRCLIILGHGVDFMFTSCVLYMELGELTMRLKCVSFPLIGNNIFLSITRED